MEEAENNGIKIDWTSKANGKVANVAEAEEVFKQFALQKTKEHKEEEERQRHKKKLVCTNTELIFLVFFLFYFFVFAQQISARKFNK